MRKFILLGSALLLGFGMNVASAQQLPNGDFERWKKPSDMGKTFYLGLGVRDEGEDKVRPANDNDNDNVVTEPTDWNGSNVDQMGQTGFFVGQEVDETGNVAVELKNDFVGIRIPGLDLGANAPGFITFATPWVYASTNTDICDGGVFGGVKFTFKPDAIKGKFKKYAQGEGKEPETSHVIAYLWNGTFTSKIGSKDNPTKETNDVDRAIMWGAGEVSGDGKLVAKCDYKITSTNGTWQEIVVPLIYEEDAGEPTKMNVIISAADYWTRSNIQAGTTLSADDVDFVYYSTLTSLEVGGVAVPNFAADKYAYDMEDAVATLPTAESISAVAKSPHAEVQVTVDEAAWQVRVVVTNQGGKDLDGEKSHTYTLQYEKPETTEYAGYLNIDMVGTPLTYNADATVKIVDYKDGTCDFILPNFKLNMGGELPLGDITVPEATMTEDASGVKTFEGMVPEMSLMGDQIKARVELNGTIDAEGKADFDVDVTWFRGDSEIPIAVTFSSDMVGEELGGYYYIVENGDYEHPVVEKKPVTLLSAQVTRTDPAFPPYTLVLKDVTFKNAKADIVVEGIVMEEENPVVSYSGTATNVELPDGTVAETVAVDGRTTDGVHYEIKFTMTVDGSESVIGFTTEPVTSGVDSVAAGEVAVYGADGAVVVDGFDGEVAVYAADGQLVKSAAVDGHAEIAVAGGLYVVRAGEAVKKVIVK